MSAFRRLWQFARDFFPAHMWFWKNQRQRNSPLSRGALLGPGRHAYIRMIGMGLYWCVFAGFVAGIAISIALVIFAPSRFFVIMAAILFILFVAGYFAFPVCWYQMHKQRGMAARFYFGEVL